MSVCTLLFTDLVDSTSIGGRLGDAAAAALWTEHDRFARTLLALHRGREIDRSDGFFLLFDTCADAAAFALAYHQGLAELSLSARAGLHRGDVTLRETPAGDVARGAKPLEVDGLAKPLAARVMALARGGQTLMSGAVAGELVPVPRGAAVRPHGFWRMKGVDEPLELFELGAAGCAFVPPQDGEKGYRVLREGDLWRPVRDVPHNLAPDRDAFVGRAAELGQLARRLGSGTRLLSIVGVGGTGKTRLARRYARAWLGEWPGGAWFCDLSEARTLDGIHFAVALALGVPLGKGDPAVQLGHVIAARGRCLVILDNFEQVVAHGGVTIGAWLDRAPDAVFVVTSRERLQLPGEQVFPVEPLELGAEAVELFAVRAQAQLPQFAIDDSNRAQVAEVVRLLDGLPLAVELAAARVRVLPPERMVLRLRDRFTLLVGARGAAERQATLRAAIDWSWELLAPWEQRALAQCSVFEGGFSLDAAEHVLDVGTFAGAPPIVDVVQSLLDKSLLRAWVPDAAARAAIAEPFFGMYLTIHEYAGAKLDSAGASARDCAETRHGHWFAGHGTDAAIELLSSRGGVRRHQTLALELDNLAAACRRALARRDVAVAVACYRAIGAVLGLRGPPSAGVALGRQVLALEGLDGTAWIDAAAACVDMLQQSGQLEAARELAERAIGCAQTAADTKREGIAKGKLGSLLREQGHMARAREHMEAALALNRAAGHQAAEATVLHHLGNLLDQVGEPERSRASHEAALVLHIERGDRHGEAHVRSGLGILNRHQGRLDDSLAQYRAALDIYREVGNRRSEGIVVGNMANTLKDLGDEEGNLRCLQEALAAHREVGSRVVEAYALANIGLALQHAGHLAEAHQHLVQALAIDRETANAIHEGVVLDNLGALEAAQGNHAAALSQFELAMCLHRRSSNRLYVGITSSHLCGSLLALGRIGEALRAVREGEDELRAIDNPTELGVLLCAKALAMRACGDAAGAEGARGEAEALAAAQGERSRLASEVAALRRALHPATD